MQLLGHAHTTIGEQTAKIGMLLEEAMGNGWQVWIVGEIEQLQLGQGSEQLDLQLLP